MKKNLWLIHLLRYTGLSFFLGGFGLIFLNDRFLWGIPLEAFLGVGLIGIILMGVANEKNFGYTTTVDIMGIPVPPLREKGYEYKSDGFIVTASKKEDMPQNDDNAK